MDFIYHLLYWFKCKQSGLDIKKSKDEIKKSAYQLDSLGGWFGTAYKPKYTRLEIPTKRVLDQKGSLCCQWYAGLVQKERDEDVELSVEALVSKARRMGFAGTKGLSSMGNSQEVFRKWGIPEDDKVQDRDPDDYNYFSSIDVSGLDGEAMKHKEQTHWFVKGRDDIFKMLDEGHILEAGITWRTMYNRGGRRPDYFYIRDNTGFVVGGHAISITGYDLNYNGRETLIYQNSYSDQWGIKGGGYIDLAWYLANNYGAVVSLDLEQDKFLTAGEIALRNDINFKGDKSPGIYRIVDGYKMAYRNDKGFLAHNGFPYTAKNAFIVVRQEELDKVPTSYGVLSVENGQYKDIVNGLKEPVNNNFKDNI